MPTAGEPGFEPTTTTMPVHDANYQTVPYVHMAKNVYLLPPKISKSSCMNGRGPQAQPWFSVIRPGSLHYLNKRLALRCPLSHRPKYLGLSPLSYPTSRELYNASSIASESGLGVTE